MQEVGSNPRMLLVPLLQALRNGDLVKLDVAITLFTRLARAELDSELLSKIIEQRSRLVSVEGVKAHLVKLALSVRNGFQINSSELFQVLRKARQFSRQGRLSDALLQDPSGPYAQVQRYDAAGGGHPGHD